MRWKWSVVCALSAGIGAAGAADETGKWYINPQAGYTWVDEDRNVDDDRHWALGIGKHLSEHWSVEVNGLDADFDGPGGRELDLQAASLDALLVFNRSGAVSPYLTFGVGYLNNDVQTDSGNGGVLGQAGLGLLIDAGANRTGSFVFQLRPEAKIRYDWVDRDQHDNFRDYLVNLGFAFNFGAPRPAPVAAAAPALPPPPPPPPPGPRDSDGDGVADDTDRCPDTPRGQAVNSVGCTRGGTVTLHGVAFEFNSAVLTAASKPVLDEVAKDLREHPRLKVELQGHTDSSGSAAYNLKLSQERADAVRDYLLMRGVGKTQLAAQGYGETQPIEDNRTGQGRSLNRRVVMAVVDNPGDVDVRGQQQDF